MPIFDTHAHYDADRFDSDRDALLSAMPGVGVGLVLDPGCDLPSSRAAAELAERYPHVYAAVGIHPEDCDGSQDENLTELRQLLEQPKVVAIGEIGLDYYWEDNPPRAFQQTVFRKQLALAAELVQAVLLVGGQLGVQLGLGAAPDGVLPGEPPLPPPLGGGLPHGLVQFGGEETALHGGEFGFEVHRVPPFCLLKTWSFRCINSTTAQYISQ